ncbi:MAG TPA: MarR family transcriptional regulator [Aquabacterium sp.]|nr:MarR family transcriptional regulator [Aquabacterium sp.]HQC97981.1 MarR family transcriptional regulator [Aquabacterium sp.]
MTERFVHRHLPYLLARASHAIWRGFEPRLRAAGLNSLEWRVLATLSDSPPLAVGELAREVLAQQPTVTKTLDRLAAQGWIERQADASDARRARIALTAAGAAHVAPLLADAQAHEAQRLQALGAPDLQRMREALQALVQHFDAQDTPRPDERSSR